MSWEMWCECLRFVEYHLLKPLASPLTNCQFLVSKSSPAKRVVKRQTKVTPPFYYLPWFFKSIYIRNSVWSLARVAILSIGWRNATTMITPWPLPRGDPFIYRWHPSPPISQIPHRLPYPKGPTPWWAKWARSPYPRTLSGGVASAKMGCGDLLLCSAGLNPSCLHRLPAYSPRCFEHNFIFNNEVMHTDRQKYMENQLLYLRVGDLYWVAARHRVIRADLIGDPTFSWD